ncbi:hypothetical protein GCM10027020_33890 [Nocardioides salsibiostraticola]
MRCGQPWSNPMSVGQIGLRASGRYGVSVAQVTVPPPSRLCPTGHKQPTPLGGNPAQGQDKERA